MRRLFPIAMAVLLAGCGTIVSQTFTNVGESLPTPAPASSSAGEEVSGTIEVVEGAAVEGPGIGIAEALADTGAEATLVNGVLLMDADGVIWLCASLLDTSPPGCGEPRLLVENYPTGGAEWDPSSAGVTGLQEADGVRWFPASQLYGVVRP
jgi:hypothetical protein